MRRRGESAAVLARGLRRGHRPAVGYEHGEPPTVARERERHHATQHHAELEKRVYGVPPSMDAEVARLKLRSFGIDIESMTPEQAEYVASWKHGT